MKWTGSIKAKQIELPEDLHAEVKAKASRMGLPIYKAYADALDRWVIGEVLISILEEEYVLTQMKQVSRFEVYNADELAMAVAYRDIEIYFRILGGAEVPPGIDIEALMDRVDLWERQRIFEISEHEKGSWWWAGLVVVCIWDAWRRKIGEAFAKGDGWKAIATTGLSIEALGATGLLITRQLFFPLAPIGLRPWRAVLAFTA